MRIHSGPVIRAGVNKYPINLLKETHETWLYASSIQLTCSVSESSLPIYLPQSLKFDRKLEVAKENFEQSLQIMNVL